MNFGIFFRDLAALNVRYVFEPERDDAPTNGEVG
jgi:hypothetical protein